MGERREITGAERAAAEEELARPMAFAPPLDHAMRMAEIEERLGPVVSGGPRGHREPMTTDEIAHIVDTPIMIHASVKRLVGEVLRLRLLVARLEATPAIDKAKP